MTKQSQWALYISRQIRDGLPQQTRAPLLPPLVEAQQLVPLPVVASADRSYITRVTEQINRTYVDGCFDACMVMVRRLLETLIIEVYERRGQVDTIKPTGEFLQFSDLVETICNDNTINLGRNSKATLKMAKDLGNTSAHNRRYCAREADVDKHSHGLRVTVEELCRLTEVDRGGQSSAASAV
jgi:hypothetical protein